MKFSSIMDQTRSERDTLVRTKSTYAALDIFQTFTVFMKWMTLFIGFWKKKERGNDRYHKEWSCIIPKCFFTTSQFCETASKLYPNKSFVDIDTLEGALEIHSKTFCSTSLRNLSLQRTLRVWSRTCEGQVNTFRVCNSPNLLILWNCSFRRFGGLQDTEGLDVL